MKTKKYDLSQVSEKTKKLYLSELLAYEGNDHLPGAMARAYSALLEEAEVKTKTAREILEDFLSSDRRDDCGEDFLEACQAIEDALKVLP